LGTIVLLLVEREKTLLSSQLDICWYLLHNQLLLHACYIASGLKRTVISVIYQNPCIMHAMLQDLPKPQIEENLCLS